MVNEDGRMEGALSAARWPRLAVRLLAGLWLLAVPPLVQGTPARDSDALTIRMTPPDKYPPVPVTDLEGFSGAEGQALLQWTAPDESLGVAPKPNVPVVSYVIHASTTSVEELGGDTTAWFLLAPALPAPPPLLPGQSQSLLTTLSVGNTWYFGLKATDDAGNVSDIDSRAKGGAGQARIPVKGIAGVTDLEARFGSTNGSIELTWTQPRRVGAGAMSYEVRVTTQGNIYNNLDFQSALPLSAFSPSLPPAAGEPGSRASFEVTGLIPAHTYAFAIRLKENDGMIGAWVRNPSENHNVNNFSQARFLGVPPDPITDLEAVTTGPIGQVRLSWTVPDIPGGSAVTGYVIRMSSLSVSDLGGDTTAWFNQAASSSFAKPTTLLTGATESFALDGLAANTTFYFGIRSIDALGAVSSLDARAASGAGQARALPQPHIELAAETGSESGSVRLTWTEPYAGVHAAPLRYDVRVSSVANIEDDEAFAAAEPLASFSSSTIPAPGAGGSSATFLVEGLTPGVTYYFGIRELDSAVPAKGTRWYRDPLRGINLGNAAAAFFISRRPDPITNLTGLPGALEGEVDLAWTAPRNQNFVKIASYTVRVATFSIAQLGIGTTAWFDAATRSLTVAPAGAPGTLETLRVTGLQPELTYFFAIKAVDVRGEESLIDVRAETGDQVRVQPTNGAPASPAGLTAKAGVNKVQLAWNDLSAVAKGPDFVGYRLYRSTLPAADFGVIHASTGTAFLDKPLTPFVTYYYKISAVDALNLESILSSTVSAMPFMYLPQEPFGFRAGPGSATVSIAWAPTTRFSDGTLFDSTATPTMDELLGYNVYRSTDPCLPFSLASVKPATVAVHTDWHYGLNYFYQIKSFNSLGVSTGALTMTSLGEQMYTMDDCASRLIVDDRMTWMMNKSSNTWGQDILISGERRPEETGGKVMQSVTFRPMMDGVTELKDFHFPAPVRVSVHYVTQGGRPVPQTAAFPVEQAFNQRASLYSTRAAEDDAKNLGLFWHNGIEYKKLYGKVDPMAQTVTAETPNLGQFQIRSVFREGGVTFDLSNITSRIFSPNGDGLNDVVIFLFDNPKASFVDGKIYDLRGAFVADMAVGPQPDTLQWDGRMNGRVVTSGVYLYQIKAEGKTFNGTVVVAR